jgi:steroid delta-isomerase-like uncharacterized protein
MSVEDFKKTVLAYVDAFNRGDLPALRLLFTPDALVYGVLGWGGLDVVEPIWRDLHHCLAMELRPESVVADGDTVAVRYAERGTSKVAFRGFPATGKSYEVVAMEFFAMKDGKIHRRWGARDSAAIYRQLGFTP